jgi:hypothetical protein
MDFASSPVFTVYSQPLHSPGFGTSPGRLDRREEFPVENGPHPQSPINMMREIQRQQRQLAHMQAQQELQQDNDSPPQSPVFSSNNDTRRTTDNTFPVLQPKSPEYKTEVPKSPILKPISVDSLLAANMENSNKAFLKSQDEVLNLLSQLGLYKYAEKMREAEVDMEALRLFEESDLKEMGIPKGPRVKILHSLHGDNIGSGCGSSIASPKLGSSIASPNLGEIGELGNTSPKFGISPKLALTPKRGASIRAPLTPKIEESTSKTGQSPKHGFNHSTGLSPRFGENLNLN